MALCPFVLRAKAFLAGASVLAFVSWSPVPKAGVAGAHPSPEMIGQARIPFVENLGQVDGRVAYYAQTFAGTVYVTRNGEVVTAVRKAEDSQANRDVATANTAGDELAEGRVAGENVPGVYENGVAIWESMVGGMPGEVRGEQPTGIDLSYFPAADASSWRSDVPSFEWVSLGEIYPGIEARLRASGNNVEKLFYLAPGSDPSQLQLKLEGIDALSINARGELLLHTPLGNVAYSTPVAWQEIDGHQVDVSVAYQISAGGLGYGFSLGNFDPQYELIIDPLIAATLVGGGASDWVSDIVIENGSVYAAGHTFSTDFPTTPGVFDSTLSGQDGQYFVSRFDMGLTTLQASTFFGLSGPFVTGTPFTTVSIDSHGGDIYIGYSTQSAANPTLSGSYDQTYNGNGDVFVARLSGDLSTLVGATYLGGSELDSFATLDVNASNGNVCVVGTTVSSNLPVSAGAHDTSYNGNTDGFVSCFDGGLTSLVASTYLGTTGVDRTRGLSGIAGAIIVGGTTSGTSSFPTPNGAFQTPFGGGSDGYVALLNANLQLISATFIGGASGDSVDHVLLHNGSVYAAGQVGDPTGFPVSGGADTSHNGNLDMFVVRFDGFLSTFQSGTFLGGSDDDYVRDIAADSDNFVYVFGLTASDNFPVSSSAFQAEKFDDLNSLTLSRLDATLGLNQFSSYLRGSTVTFNGTAFQMAVSAPKEVYLPGASLANSYITTANAYQTTPVGLSFGGMVTHLSLESLSSELSMGFLPISTPESVGTLSIEVTRTGSLVGLCEVYIQYTDGIAVNGMDYDAGLPRLRWEPGDGTSKFIQVDITDDDYDELDEDFFIGLIHPAGASIAAFGGGRTITIVDDDTAGVSVSAPQPDGSLREIPDTASITVNLDSEPANGAVFITAYSDDTSAGTLDGADMNGEVQLMFDSNNWNVPQAVVVESVDDDIDDGDQPFQVDFAQIVNPDPNYDGVIPLSANFVTVDDEVAGVDIQSANMPLVTSEAGTSDELSYRLTSEPLATVQINLTPDADGLDEGMLSNPNLTFTPQNWNTLQPVTVTGLDDMIIDGDIQYQILSQGVSNDPLYDFAMTNFGPLVINQDDDALSVDVMLTVDDGETQMMPFIATVYRIDIVNNSGVPIDDIQVVTTTTLLDDASMTWNCQATGMSNCDAISGAGNISTTVDLEANGLVTIEVLASAVNQPFQQAVLTAEAFVPFGFSDTNPGNNFNLDSNLIFVFIVFEDSFEDP